MRFFNKFKNIFTKEELMKFRDDAQTYCVAGGWGNCIDIGSPSQEEHTFIVYGFLPGSNFPREGDRLIARMQGGGIGEYIFTKVERMRDPRDMFTGLVHGPFDYTGEKPVRWNSPSEMLTGDARGGDFFL